MNRKSAWVIIMGVALIFIASFVVSSGVSYSPSSAAEGSDAFQLVLGVAGLGVVIWGIIR